MQLSELLLSLSEMGVAVFALSLVIYQFVKAGRTQFNLVVGMMLALLFVHVWYEKHLMSLAADDSLKPLVRELWYLGFAASDIAFVWLCVKLSKRRQLDRLFATDTILASYLVLAGVQLLRYIDRIVIKTDALGALYQLAIPTINIAIMGAVVATVAGLTVHKMKRIRRSA